MCISLVLLARVTIPCMQAQEQTAAITRAKTYVAGSDKDVVGGYFVSSVNEWAIRQPRVLILSRTAYYRVTYSHKTGRIDHYHKTEFSKVRVIEKTATGIKLFLTEQDGKASVGKVFSSMFSKKPKDEFEHVREYLPTAPTSGPSIDVVIDVIAASLHKAAELCSKSSSGFAVPSLITTEGRKAILSERKEAERLEKERVEREAAAEELAAAVASATATRDGAPPEPQEGGSAAMATAAKALDKPLKRAKKAVEFPADKLAEAESLKTELEDLKKARETAERLERERVEREAASEELANAVAEARESRDAATLVKPIKRAKKAVDFPEDKLTEADSLRTELEEEKKAADAKAIEDARLEKERVEREAAAEELAAAVASATATRDGAPPEPQEGGSTAMATAAKALDKPLKRAKKAVEFPADKLAEAESLKTELEDLKKARETAERLERERVEREAASEELSAEIEAAETSRDTAALVKAIKRAKKAVDVDTALIGKADALKVTCDEEKVAAAKAAKEEAAAAKAEASAKLKAEKEATEAAAKATAAKETVDAAAKPDAETDAAAPPPKSEATADAEPASEDA